MDGKTNESSKRWSWENNSFCWSPPSHFSWKPTMCSALRRICGEYGRNHCHGPEPIFSRWPLNPPHWHCCHVSEMQMSWGPTFTATTIITIIQQDKLLHLKAANLSCLAAHNSPPITWGSATLSHSHFPGFKTPWLLQPVPLKTLSFST